LISQALLVVSGHEGFCLPLVEAMGLRVPIVATPTTAIPDTAGDVATYVQSGEASDLADALHAVGNDAERREELLNRGWRRYREQFRNQMIGRQFLELVEGITARNQVAA
jgi:glycosyltransferase involved in cell wall biosynthesis